MLMVRQLKKVLHFRDAAVSVEYRQRHVDKHGPRNNKGVHLAVIKLHCFKKYKGHY